MNSVGTTRIVKYSPRVVSNRNSTPKKVRVKKSCEPMLVRKCKSVRRKSRKPVRRRSKSVRRRSKSRKSRKPVRRRLKSVRRGSKSVRKRSKIPQKPKSVKPKSYHKPLVEKKKTPKKIRVKKSQPSLIRQMSIDNSRDLLPPIINPKYLQRRPYTPLYLERIPAPPEGYRGMSPYFRFKKHTKMKRSFDDESMNREPMQSKRKIDFKAVCRKLECYTRINEISFNVIRDFNSTQEYMFNDLFTYIWDKIMTDPNFKKEMGIDPTLQILVYPDLVLDLNYGGKLINEISEFIQKIKIMAVKKPDENLITPFQLGTPGHIIPGMIRWESKTIEMYDMNEVPLEAVMKDILQKVMRVENSQDEKNQWTWTWDFSCAPFHSQILKEIRKCSQEYNLSFPEGLCASISIFMVIKNLQAPTKSLSIIYREVSERLVTPYEIQGVLNEMLKYFELLDEWYKKFYEYFPDEDLHKYCEYNIKQEQIKEREKLDREMLARFEGL